MLSMSRCTIVGNSAAVSGGGIAARGGSVLTIAESTIQGNSTPFNGGGVFVGQHGGTIVNSTVSGNMAGRAGGGIYTVGTGTTLAVRFTTITANSARTGLGGGISAQHPKVQLLSTIVAGNTNGDVRFVSNPASFESLGYNLVGDGNGVVAFSAAKGDLIGVAPMLGPLAYYGGPTMTHALLSGSQAIDAGDPDAMGSMGDVPEFDQRGAPWSRVVGGRIDVGAVESQPNPLAGDYNLNGSVDAADYVIWRKTLGADVASGSGADGDGDAMVDEDDHGVWRTNFGRTGGTGSGELGAGSGEERAGTQAAAVLDEPVLPVRGQETRPQQSRGQETRTQRAMFEPSPSPTRPSSPQASLRGRGTERALELRVADERDGALAAWLALRGRADGAENDDVIEELRYVCDEAGRESTFHDVFDEVFASRKFLATL
jgi:predicted outer membrane repeat protein